jgi:hypothetical protein
MPLSYVPYQGDGETVLFAVTFPYILQEHVHVYLNGAETTAFEWLTPSSIQLTSDPPVGTVLIRRITPSNEQLTDYIDGSSLTEETLDLQALQVFYLAQEANDNLGTAIALDANDPTKWNGQDRRASNFADPTDPKDLVTLGWATTAVTGFATQSAASADRAEAAAGVATQAADAASGAADAVLDALNLDTAALAAMSFDGGYFDDPARPGSVDLRFEARPALVQNPVLSDSLTVAPTSPALGAGYIVAAGATGEWATHVGHIATYGLAGWAFHAPAPGWLVWVISDARMKVWDGSTWTNSDTGVLVNTDAVASPTDVVIQNDAGRDASIGAATTIRAGVMTAAQVAELNAAPKTGSAVVAAINSELGGPGWMDNNLSVNVAASSVTVASEAGTDAVIPAATDALAGVMSATDKLTLDALAARRGYVILAADQVNSTITWADLAGMSFNAAANTTYLVRAFMTFKSAALTTGASFALGVPAGADVVGQVTASISTTGANVMEQRADGLTTATATAVSTINVNIPAEGTFVVKTGATAGAVKLRFVSEVAASAVTAVAGLTVMIWEKVS